MASYKYEIQDASGQVSSRIVQAGTLAEASGMLRSQGGYLLNIAPAAGTASILERMRDRINVRLHLVGHADSRPLSPELQAIFGDNAGLSRERAGQVAEFLQGSLGLPADSITYAWAGDSEPVASNLSEEGRALNRRVEVEFWYDDPLQELPDEPQLCPGDAGAEMVTRVYDPPWGTIGQISFAGGQPVIPDGYTAQLDRALADVADKTNPRLRFVGYTRNERLERRTAAVYGDDIGLSASRARRAMEQVAGDMSLESGQTEFEGRGFVHSDDVVNAGFIQGETSHVAVQVVYDELAILDDYEGVDVTRMTRELEPQNPLGLNLMRITVDGEPIDDPQRSSSDIQRCTDVAFAGADIQFGYDNMRSSPRLAVMAQPARIDVGEDGSGILHASPVRFRMYTNYSHFIDRAEIRVFRTGQSLESLPLDVIDLDIENVAEWTPAVDEFRAPGDELAYVTNELDLRTYAFDVRPDGSLTNPRLFVEEGGEQGRGSEGRFQARDRVEEVVLVRVAPGGCAIKAGNAGDARARKSSQGADRLAHRAPTIARIAAQGNPRHGPRRRCFRHDWVSDDCGLPPGFRYTNVARASPPARRRIWPRRCAGSSSRATRSC